MKQIDRLKAHPLVEEVSDERGNGDGIWAYLKPGYQNSIDPGTHQVHEDTFGRVLAVLKDAVPCACADCKAYAQRKAAA